MKRKWTYIKGLLLLCFVLFLAGFSHYKNSTRKIISTEINFNGDTNLFITSETVDSLLIQNSKPIKNQLKTAVNLFSLENAINKHPMIEKADVSTSVDGILSVDILQKKPIARVLGQQAFYIDENAHKMPLSLNYSARVPTISGTIKKENYKDIQYIVTKIQHDDFLSKQLVGIKKLENNNYQLLPRIGNHTIILGDTSRLHEKLINLKVFYKKALKDSIIHKYSKINLQYNHQVIATKKEEYGTK